MTDLKQLLKDNGVVGAGGAGFPSYCKLAEGADTLIINAVGFKNGSTVTMVKD